MKRKVFLFHEKEYLFLGDSFAEGGYLATVAQFRNYRPAHASLRNDGFIYNRQDQIIGKKSELEYVKSIETDDIGHNQHEMDRIDWFTRTRYYGDMGA